MIINVLFQPDQMKYDRSSGSELDFYSGEQSLNHMQGREVWKRNGL